MKTIFMTIIILCYWTNVLSSKELFKFDKDSLHFSSPASNFVCYYPNSIKSLANDTLLIKWNKKYIVPMPIGWESTKDIALQFLPDSVDNGEFVLPPLESRVCVVQFYPHKIPGNARVLMKFWVDNNENDTTNVIFDYVADPILSVLTEFDESVETINLFDINGRLIKSSINIEELKELELTNKGVYFLEVKKMNKEIYYHKIIY